jgi:hypothetical protein
MRTKTNMEDEKNGGDEGKKSKTILIPLSVYH